jgi:glycosyltransferase involved in cell wall biosynthesis
LDQIDVAVLIPCYDEQPSIAQVVRDFKAALPYATVYVYDNNSRDRTAEAARGAGAVVRHEARQGKGFVVRRMFADVEADVYVMVDGDGTYDAAAAPLLISALLSGPYDLVNGARVANAPAAYRRGHAFGNRMLTGLVVTLFGAQGRDMLSGYKAMSRRFVKSFPPRSRGFEIETEILIHAAELEVPMTEIEVAYRERPGGSFSKLNTIGDGMRILRLIGHLIRTERPLQFFGLIGLLLVATGLALSAPVIVEYFATGLVPRLPTFVASVGLVLTGVLSFFVGLILNTVVAVGREQKRLAYLGYASASAHPSSSAAHS